jgi:hypothetical protein
VSIAISIASHTSDEKMGTAQYEIPHILMYEPNYEQVDVCVEIGGDALREGVNGLGRRSFDAGCNGEGEARDQLPKGKNMDNPANVVLYQGLRMRTILST